MVCVTHIVDIFQIKHQESPSEDEGSHVAHVGAGSHLVKKPWQMDLEQLRFNCHHVTRDGVFSDLLVGTIWLLLTFLWRNFKFGKCIINLKIVHYNFWRTKMKFWFCYGIINLKIVHLKERENSTYLSCWGVSHR